MDMKKKGRSSLKCTDSTVNNRLGTVTEGTAKPKRRISFCGRKSVREFHAEEKPKSWNNSYEVSDPINITGNISTEVYDEHSHKFTEGVFIADKSLFRADIQSLDKENLDNNIDGVGKTFLKEEHQPKAFFTAATVPLPPCVTSIQSKSHCLSVKNKSEDLHRTIIYDENICEDTSSGSVDATYYGNDEILLDDANSSNKKTLTMLQSILMDCTTEGEVNHCKNVPNQTIIFSAHMNIENCTESSNKTEVVKTDSPVLETKGEEDRSFSNRLEAFNFNSVECRDSHSAGDCEIINKEMEASAVNITELITPGSGNNMGEQQIHPEGTSNMSCFSGAQKSFPLLDGSIMNSPITNVAMSSKVDTSETISIAPKQILDTPGTKKVSDLPNCEAIIGKSAMDIECLQENNSKSTTFYAELDSPSRTRSPVTSFSSSLFPVGFILTKNKKLNLRQLNDQIGHGKIVVFPNKCGCSEINNCIEKNSNSRLEKEVQIENASQMENNTTNLQEAEKSIEIKLGNFQGINHKKKHESGYFESDEMLLDSTSFLVRAKLGDESVSRNCLKTSGVHIRSSMHLNSEIDATLNPMVESVDSIITEKQNAFESKGSDKVMLDNNDPMAKTQTSSVINNQPVQLRDGSKSRRMSVYKVEDISLTDRSVEICQNEAMMQLPTKCGTTEIHNGKTEELPRAITIESCEAREPRKTIYFNQGIETDNDQSMPILQSEMSKSIRKRHTLIFTPNNAELGNMEIQTVDRNNSRELVYAPTSPAMTPLQVALLCPKSVDISDGSNDSFMLKLNEVRVATFSSCKRRTGQFGQNNYLTVDPCTPVLKKYNSRTVPEVTPHRSVIEFEFLEMEAEEEQKRFEAKGEGNNRQTNLPHIPGRLRRETLHEITNLDLSGLKLIEHDNCNSPMIISPKIDSLVNKRLAANLTPNMSLPKKRQTLVFQDCMMDESIMPSANMKFNIISNNNKDAEQLNTNFLMESSNSYVPENIKLVVPHQKNITFDEKNAVRIDSSNTVVATNPFPQLNETISDNVDVTSNVITSTLPAEIAPKTSLMVSNCGGKVQRSFSNLSTRINETDMECSIDMIQAPRRDVTFTRTRDSNIALPLETDEITTEAIIFETEEHQNPKYMFEGNPITISDVSGHYLAQGNSLISKEEKAAINEINYTKSFINLTSANSRLSLSDMDDIDKTRLSLVDTLLSDNVQDIEDVDEEDEVDESFVDEQLRKDAINHDHVSSESCSALLACNEFKEGVKEVVESNQKNRTLCHRCKQCQQVLSSESVSATTESFALPTVPQFPSLRLERLKRLRKHPTLKQVHEYWQRRSLERTNLSAKIEQYLESEDEPSFGNYTIDIKTCIQDLKKMERQISDLHILKPLKTDIAVQRLNCRISDELPNWIFDTQMQARNIFQLYHKKIFTFAIEILYEDKGLLGNDIEIKDIYLQSGRIPRKFWKPIDYLLDYNLKIRLPFDLKSLFNHNKNENGALQLLQHVDRVCTEVITDGFTLWRRICNEQAVLLRDQDRIIIRKILREVVHAHEDEFPYVKKIEFNIELQNILKISFKNILSPPLHAFSERLRFLPCGIDFLYVFLQNPSHYLRSDEKNGSEKH